MFGELIEEITYLLSEEPYDELKSRIADNQSVVKKSEEALSKFKKNPTAENEATYRESAKAALVHRKRLSDLHGQAADHPDVRKKRSVRATHSKKADHHSRHYHGHEEIVNGEVESGHRRHGWRQEYKAGKAARRKKKSAELRNWDWSQGPP